MECAGPENIHTPTTDGIGNFLRGGELCETNKIKEMYAA